MKVNRIQFDCQWAHIPARPPRWGCRAGLRAAPPENDNLNKGNDLFIFSRLRRTFTRNNVRSGQRGPMHWVWQSLIMPGSPSAAAAPGQRVQSCPVKRNLPRRRGVRRTIVRHRHFSPGPERHISQPVLAPRRLPAFVSSVVGWRAHSERTAC